MEFIRNRVEQLLKTAESEGVIKPNMTRDLRSRFEDLYDKAKSHFTNIAIASALSGGAISALVFSIINSNPAVEQAEDTSDGAVTVQVDAAQDVTTTVSEQ